MKLTVATTTDIDDILKLHAKYQIDTIQEEDKKDGFVTTPFTKEELSSLIDQEQGIFIARADGEVVAYVMSASWDFWSKWEMFRFMVSNLDGKQYQDIKITSANSYQYGPVCIDKRYRGSGLLEQIFAFALEKMSKRFEILITFVNKENPRSMKAHRQKIGLDVLSEFEYNGNSYCELVCRTR